MKIWIDDSQCDQRWHSIEREERQLICVHADGSICDDTEFTVVEDEQ